MSAYKIIITAIAALALIGCASHGRQLDTNYIDTIKKGETTEKELISNLGAPMTVSIMPDGLKLMMYMHVYSQAKASSYIPIVGSFAGGTDTDTQMLQIWIDQDGLVKNFVYSNNESEINTGILAN